MTPVSTDKVTLADVERVLPLKSWWAVLAVLPLVRPLTVLVVNRTRITPNAITVTSLVLRVFAALAFFLADRPWLAAGACAFYFAYVLDCMDGAVARLRKQSSEFGRFLDHVGDLVGGVLAVVALALGQHMLFTPLVAGILFCHISEYYISYLTSTVLAERAPDATAPERGGVFGTYLGLRSFFHSRNYKSFFSFPDYEAATFFVFPLLGMPALGLKVGFCLVLTVTLYTVLSSFTAINCGGKKFP